MTTTDKKNTTKIHRKEETIDCISKEPLGLIEVLKKLIGHLEENSDRYTEEDMRRASITWDTVSTDNRPFTRGSMTMEFSVKRKED